MIKQFLRDVDWEGLDFLLIDTPPGTSDEHLSLVQFLSGSGIDGAIIVTTPQEVALCDVRKEINFCHKTSVPILGVVENMADFICPKCQKSSIIFPPTSGGASKMASESGAPFLGSLPLDPRLAQCCDEGKSFLEEMPDSPATAAFLGIVRQVVDYCDNKHKKTQQSQDSTNAENGENSLMDIS